MHIVTHSHIIIQTITPPAKQSFLPQLLKPIEIQKVGEIYQLTKAYIYRLILSHI